MKSFADTVAQIMKNLVAGPIGAQDMNAGEAIVNKPDKHYGRDEDADLYREDEELDKSVVPQHYVPEYGRVEVLFKAGPPALVIKAEDKLRDDITDREIVVGGYSSPQVIDREKHLITKEAMAKDLPRFLAEPLFANAMILHSNVQVGQVLSEWTNPETGKVYKTQVDEIGLFCVIKIRTDKYRPKIVDKVIEDIEKGNLKAFSISGDAPLASREHKCDGGECFWVIPSIEFYEITICLPGNQKIYTSTGLRKIKDIHAGELVLTHKLRWRPVLRTMQRQIDDAIIRLTLDNGKFLEATREHPVRALRYRGRNEGTHYEWVPAGEIKEGDLVSFHEPDGTCRACGRLIFRQWKKGNHTPDFCDTACKAEVPNRKGKTMANGDPGAAAQAEKLRGRAGGTGGPAYWTDEGRAKHHASVTSKDFKEKAKVRAAAQWQDPSFVRAQMQARGVRPNKLEKSFGQLLRPLGFSYVGDGRLVIGGKVPDYHDGSDKLIELYGDYWHKGQDPKDRIDFFRERGYETLIVWERDLNANHERVQERVEEFIQNKLERVVKVERIPFKGLVYNLEVAEDNSYVTEAMATHNCEEGVNQGAKLMILAKSCDDGKCGLIQKQPVPEGDIDEEQPEPTPQASLPTGVLDMDAEATKEELAERVGEVAEEVGEKEAAEMIDDVAAASKKLDNVGTGIGSGGSGDANTMAHFGKPYSRDTAVAKGDPSIDRFFQAYRIFLARGASPEDAYFKLLEDGADGEPAPDWFGTRDGKFRQFLLQAHHSGLPIPTIRLRMQGNKEGEIVADPSMMAFDLLQTAINRMRGLVDKDVSPVAHDEHDEEDCEREEAEQAERYYLNLALKALSKSDSTLGAIAGSKIHEAYTVAMDGIYRLGHLTQEQRIDLSSAIAEALDAFHEEIGEIGDLKIPAEDVALLMKARPRKDKCMKCDMPPEVVVIWAEGMAQAWFCEGCLKEWKKENGDDIVSEKKVDGKVEKHCQGSGEEFHMHPPDFQDFSEVCGDKVDKHKDKQGSTAHHQTGGGTGGVAQPPQSQWGADQQIEERVKTLTAEVKERNLKGASLRLFPGHRNAPYSVTGMDALQRPVRLVGNVADITVELRENAAEVDAIMEERKMDNYAVPVEVGVVNELQIYEGDGVSPMDVVREQVARASFDGAVATVLKNHTGVRGRDFLMDEKQQVEPENVSVMGGVRTPGNRNQDGHATTEIEQGGDVEGISGTKINIPTEPLDTPPAAGIAQQGAVSPPQGVQGIGETPKFVQVHDDEPMHGARKEQEGVGMSPEADEDSRGAPVTSKTRRP